MWLVRGVGVVVAPRGRRGRGIERGVEASREDGKGPGRGGGGRGNRQGAGERALCVRNT
jgi:hypothetical protein